MRRWGQIVLVNRSCPHTFNPRLQAVKTFWPDFTPLRFFSKMFLTTEIVQSQGVFFDLLFNLRKKHLRVRKKEPFLILPRICSFINFKFFYGQNLIPWIIIYRQCDEERCASKLNHSTGYLWLF